VLLIRKINQELPLEKNIFYWVNAKTLFVCALFEVRKATHKFNMRGYAHALKSSGVDKSERTAKLMKLSHCAFHRFTENVLSPSVPALAFCLEGFCEVT
jgi:hypothetical protein